MINFKFIPTIGFKIKNSNVYRYFLGCNYVLIFTQIHICNVRSLLIRQIYLLKNNVYFKDFLTKCANRDAISIKIWQDLYNIRLFKLL